MAASLKFVFVGDSFVGKTCYLYSYLNGEYPPELMSATIGSSRIVERLQDSHIEFYDTAGVHAFRGTRILTYPGTDVFMVCFAVDNRSSFNNVSSEWLPEVREVSGSKVPIILVGLKADLKKGIASQDDELADSSCATQGDHNESVDSASVTQNHYNESINSSCVTRDEALNLVKIEKMFAYVECSAISGVGCQEPIKKAMEAADIHCTNKSQESKLCADKKPESKCCLII